VQRFSGAERLLHVAYHFHSAAFALSALPARSLCDTWRKPSPSGNLQQRAPRQSAASYLVVRLVFLDGVSYGAAASLRAVFFALACVIL
jgi:hypothetical protein